MPRSQHAVLTAALTEPRFEAAGVTAVGDHVYPAVIIKEGVFTPGIGGNGQAVQFTAEWLKENAKAFDGTPVKAEHEDGVFREVGFVEGTQWDEEARGLRANLVIQKVRAGFEAMVGFIEGRKQAGKVPNVSIEVIRPVTAEPTVEGADVRLVGGIPDGVAILPKGACGDEAGCGIGFSGERVLAMTVIKPPESPAFSTQNWDAPRLKDFDGDLAKARDHFFWTARDPPESFGDLKLPYREVSGDVNLAAVRAILAVLGGARGGVDIPAGDRDSIRGHAQRLLDEGNQAAKMQPTLEVGIQLQPPAGQGDPQGEQNMGDEDPTPCTCGGQEAALAAKVEDLEGKLTAAKKSLEDLTKEHDVALGVLKGYADQERTDAVEAFTEAMPQGADPADVLGCKVDEASTEALQLATRTMKKLGLAAPAAGGKGRRTVLVGRDQGKPNAASVLKLKRIAEGGIEKMPDSMRARTKELLAKHKMEVGAE